jgi:hypothetical protein
MNSIGEIIPSPEWRVALVAIIEPPKRASESEATQQRPESAADPPDREVHLPRARGYRLYRRRPSRATDRRG